MTLSLSQLMIKYPSSSLHNSRPSSILSLTHNIDVSPYDVAAILAELAEERLLLEEAEGLLPEQAPPEPSSGLIASKHTIR